MESWICRANSPSSVAAVYTSLIAETVGLFFFLAISAFFLQHRKALPSPNDIWQECVTYFSQYNVIRSEIRCFWVQGCKSPWTICHFPSSATFQMAEVAMCLHTWTRMPRGTGWSRLQWTWSMAEWERPLCSVKPLISVDCYCSKTIYLFT